MHRSETWRQWFGWLLRQRGRHDPDARIGGTATGVLAGVLNCKHACVFNAFCCIFVAILLRSVARCFYSIGYAEQLAVSGHFRMT